MNPGMENRLAQPAALDVAGESSREGALGAQGTLPLFYSKSSQAPDLKVNKGRHDAEPTPLQHYVNHLLHLRDASEVLYRELDIVIDSCSRAPARIGFRIEQPDSVQLHNLIKVCDYCINQSNPLIRLGAGDEVAVATQTHAKNLKSLAQSIRAFVYHGDLVDGVPEPALAVVLERAIMFQRQAADCMNDTASLLLGLKVERQVL